MVIAKGEPWGERIARPDGLVVVGSDADLAEMIATGTDAPLAVGAGDLHRTIGGSISSDVVVRVPLDVLHCELDGLQRVAVANVVARRGWWRGPLYGVFNAQYLGTWDVAPRGHPNDGRAEVIEISADMGIRQRWEASRRAPGGTHVPHPAIRTTHSQSVQWTFERPLDVYVDGVRHRRIRSLTVSVEADAHHLHI